MACGDIAITPAVEIMNRSRLIFERMQRCRSVWNSAVYEQNGKGGGIGLMGHRIGGIHALSTPESFPDKGAPERGAENG